MDHVKIYDYEVYPNLFVAVFMSAEEGDDSKDIFYRWTDAKTGEVRSNLQNFADFLKQKTITVGYNNLGYDSQITQFILKHLSYVTNEAIYQFSKWIVIDRNKLDYNDPKRNLEVRRIAGEEYEFKFHFEQELWNKEIDLYKLWSYDNKQRRTSLKWLEFSMREKMIKDLPFGVDKNITEKQVKKVVKYCVYDVEKTKNFWFESQGMLKDRHNAYLSTGRDFSVYNKGDVKLGAHMMLQDLAEKTGESAYKIKKKRTIRKELNIGDIVFDYIEFQTPEFKEVLEMFKNRKADEISPKTGTLSLEGVFKHTAIFDGVEYDYGFGGLHASIKNGFLVADEDYIIMDVDAKSYYPRISIVNELAPEHLGKAFISLYDELYNKRVTFPKSDPRNKEYKLRLNAAFGLSNSPYSFMYDPAFTAGITVNGQLMLSMLSEAVSEYGRTIQVNTDGITFIFRQKYTKQIEKILKDWEKRTGMILESEYYKFMFIRDVNTYSAQYIDGSVKRKGGYAIYEDYVSESEKLFHKNPSGLIIPTAVNEYLVNGTDIEKTILEGTDIHDYLFGFKKKRDFIFVELKAKDNGYIVPKKHDDRVIRYFISKEGTSLYKLTDKLGFSSLKKDYGVKILQNVGAGKTSRFKNQLDYNYYIEEALAIIEETRFLDADSYLKRDVV